MDPFKTDLFTLRVLSFVYERRSFTDAATALGVNQSVVSYAISRLRDLVGDPLFLRQGGGIVATDRCIAIVADVDEILERYAAIIAPQEIDPQRIEKNFCVSCNFFERNWILSPVIRALRDEAPLARLTIIQAGTQGAQHLAQGAADLLIGPMRPEGDNFYCRSLMRDQYACVMDRANPLAEAPLTLDAYLAANHVEVAYGDGWTSDYMARLSPETETRPRTVITVPSPGDIHNVVRDTDLIATIPQRFACTMLDHLHVTDFPLPAMLEIGMVWSARNHGSGTQKWFRDLVARTVKAR